MVGFLHYQFGGSLYLEGLIHEAAYFRNFMVFHVGTKHVSLHNCSIHHQTVK